MRAHLCARSRGRPRRRPRASSRGAFDAATSRRSSAQARVAERLDREAGGDSGEDVTFDLDATDTEVYGHAKQGAARGHGGGLGYCSYVVTWAQRGRAMTSELVGANRARISAKESAAMIARARKLLPAGYGQLQRRADGRPARAAGALQHVRAVHHDDVARALREIPEHAWADATAMRGAQVAEIAFTPTGWQHEPLRLIVRRATVSAAELRAGNPRGRGRTTIPADQLQMILEGCLDSTFAYSFIVTDIPAERTTTTEVEHLCRRRAQIEERCKT